MLPGPLGLFLFFFFYTHTEAAHRGRRVCGPPRCVSCDRAAAFGRFPNTHGCGCGVDAVRPSGESAGRAADHCQLRARKVCSLYIFF